MAGKTITLHLKPKAFILLTVLLVIYGAIYATTLISKYKNTVSNPNFLISGHYYSDSGNFPALLQINPNDFSVNKIDLDAIGISDTEGFHEARPFMNGSVYHVALASYGKGKFIILKSNNPFFTSTSIDFEETFDRPERVRAVISEDVNGDSKIDVVVGTRPSGIVKIFENKNKKWVGNEIDRVGSAIHDVVVLDTDGNGAKEIIVTTSTTYEYQEKNLQERIPEIIKYEYVTGKWIKNVIWKPDNPTLELGVYIHPRYIFTNNPDKSGIPEIITSVIGNSTLHGLLTLRWNGSEYSTHYQEIGLRIKLSPGVITYGDIDNDGIEEILIPTLTGETLLLYKKNDDKWENEILTVYTPEKNGDKEQIVAVTLLDSIRGRHKRILLATAVNGYEPGGVPKFYTLEFNQLSNKWDLNLVNAPDLPKTFIWGIFPMSSWKIPKFDN